MTRRMGVVRVSASGPWLSDAHTEWGSEERDRDVQEYGKAVDQAQDPLRQRGATQP